MENIFLALVIVQTVALAVQMLRTILELALWSRIINPEQEDKTNERPEKPN